MTQEVKLRRAQCNYQAENARFLLECDFSRQYSSYYCKRLEKTRPFLEFNCRNKWHPSIPIYSLAKMAAAIASDGSEHESMGLSPPTDSPEDLSGASGSFKFTKRMRRLSETLTQSPQQTSTQLSRTRSQSPLSRNLNLQHITPLQSPILAQGQQSSRYQDCVVVGTIFKRMKLQPDVVEELSRGDFHVKCDRYSGHYTSQDDELVLEDVDESISLVGNIDPGEFVTGIVVALLGRPIDDGSQFLVRDICFAEPNRLIIYDDGYLSQSQPTNAPIEMPSQQKPVYLMVVSGLGFHQDMGKKSALTKALQNMIDFVWGGSKYESDERSSQVARILVLGDSLSEDRFAEELHIEPRQDELSMKMKQSRQVKPYSGSIQAVKHMDDFFAQLSKTIYVDVMPGLSDPSSQLMPQQPFHPCMFPKSCMFATFNCTTNPYHAIFDESVEILATSGQNVDIISKFSNLSDPVNIMKHHLMWGNLAPSAPDNLYSAPCEDEDPYVIDFIPDIYIAGCQKSYCVDTYDYASNQMGDNQHNPASLQASPLNSQAKFMDNIAGDTSTKKSKTMIVTVPKFFETFLCVLIDLKTLKAEPLHLG